MASSFLKFLDHTQRRTTVGRISSGRVISSSQRPLPDNTQHSQQTNIYALDGIRTHDVSKRAAADLRLRPRRYWDRHFCSVLFHCTISSVDVWLTVLRSITLVDLQLDAQNSYLFIYITFIKILYMFRTLPCLSSGGLCRNCIYAASGIVTLCR
jgi:hypothetical protein